MERQEFAALLAQVIPVLILALVVEFRAVGDYWLRVIERLEAKLDATDRRILKARGDVRQNLWGQVAVAAVLLFYLVIEVAALLAASGVPGIGGAAGPHMVPLLGLGFLMVIALQSLNMVWAFYRMAFIGTAYTAVVMVLLCALLVAGGWAVFALAALIPQQLSMG